MVRANIERKKIYITILGIEILLFTRGNPEKAIKTTSDQKLSDQTKHVSHKSCIFSAQRQPSWNHPISCINILYDSKTLIVQLSIRIMIRSLRTC